MISRITLHEIGHSLSLNHPVTSDGNLVAASGIMGYNMSRNQIEADEVIDIVENLFKDACVEHNRHNSRGEAYSIAEEAVNEFLSWENMPWES